MAKVLFVFDFKLGIHKCSQFVSEIDNEFLAVLATHFKAKMLMTLPPVSQNNKPGVEEEIDVFPA